MEYYINYIYKLFVLITFMDIINKLQGSDINCLTSRQL